MKGETTAQRFDLEKEFMFIHFSINKPCRLKSLLSKTSSEAD